MGAHLSGTVRPRAEVDPAEADRLYDLFVRYYLNVERATFDRDLAEKDWVLLLRDAAGELRGFTTLKLYDVELLGRRVRAVFNGNTIIDRASWGDQELVRAWCGFMAQLKSHAPSVPLYWYLISSGYRTYLYLPLFFREFYPRHDVETPLFEARLIDCLGRMKFPDEYRDGCVRVAEPRECLRPDLAVPLESRARNPHVRFFLERNRGYLRGDELVCVAEYSLENTRRMAHTALSRLSHPSPEPAALAC